MRVPFSQLPRRHERQLRRRRDGRRFPRPITVLPDGVLVDAQRQGDEELIAFVADLRGPGRQLTAAWSRLARMEAPLGALLAGPPKR